jgi:nitrate reductase molybdenum cofactor assembly chaperone NarJ/NarW
MTGIGVVKRARPALGTERHRVAFAAASALLRYPDEALLEDLPLFASAAGRLPSTLRQPFAKLCDHLTTMPLLDAQARYVATFDLKRRCCLYLSYYLNGDTRRRGQALWRFQDAYRRAGFQIVGGELPDYLPALLELAATGAEAPALELLQEHRAGLHVLFAALDETGSPYAGVIGAVDSLLPAPTTHLIATAARIAREGPPTELVGVEPREAFEPYRATDRGVAVTIGRAPAPGAGGRGGQGAP